MMVLIIVLTGAADTQEGLENADAFLREAGRIESLLAKVDQFAIRFRTTRDSSVADRSKEEKLFSPQLENLRLLAAIVESSEDAILSKTMDGKITTWNGAAERMYGYCTDEILGKSVSILQPADRPAEVYDILERLKNGEKIDHFETMRVAKDGHLLAVSLTMSPIRDAQGQMIGASTIAHDITRTKLAAQSLRNAEDMAAVGRMASTVAHEINNPLQAVANALYLLAGSPSLDASARQFLAIAQDQLAKIATVPLGLSRAEAEHHPPILVSHRDSAA